MVRRSSTLKRDYPLRPCHRRADLTSFGLDSIQKNPREPTFFTNRALTRIRLEKWAGVEHDARAAIELYGPKNPQSLKSCWYLAQALLGLGRPQEAYEVAIDAYRASLAAKSAQTENLSKTVLRAKQQIWAAKETARLREMNDTLATVESLIETDLNRELAELQAKLDKGEIGQTGFVEDQQALRADAEKNIQNVREAFRIASNGDIQERVSGHPCAGRECVRCGERISNDFAPGCARLPG
jgi:STIP1 family protein 1